MDQNISVIHISMAHCTERVYVWDKIRGGDERVTPSELRRRHSAREIDDATRDRATLVEGVVFAALANKVFQRSSKQGHRLAAGKSSTIGSSQDGTTNKICGLRDLTTSACKEGKTRWYGSVDDAVNMLACPTRPRLGSA